VQHPLVAYLHDDDWWAPEHLERALQALRSNPGCVAVFSNYFFTEGPEYPPSFDQGPSWRIWIATGCNLAAPVLDLTRESVLLASLLNTSFAYPTMVGEAGAVRESYCEILETGNEYDNDRTFPVFLASRGTIAFLTVPDVYIRSHPGQDTRRSKYSGANSLKHMRRTTEWMRARWPTEFAAAIGKFNSAFAALDPACQAAVGASVNGQLAEFGLTLPRQPRSFRWFLRQIAPPILSGLYGRLRRGHA